MPSILFDNRSTRLSLPPGAPFSPGPEEAIRYGQGALALRGPCASLFDRIDAVIRDFAAPLGAEEIVLPAALTLEDYRKTGYSDRLPQYTTQLSTGGVCSSAACLCCYPCLAGKVFEPAGGIAFTTRGRVFRQEKLSPDEPERLREFHQRDIIFLGTEEYVEGQLDKCMEWLKGIAGDLGIHGIIQPAEDPFFGADAEVLKAYQKATRSKFELQLIAPKSTRAVAVASVNRHGSHFAKSFNLRLRGGDFIHTGCMGVGLERLALLIGSHYSFDRNLWPGSLRARFG
jgi:seryl-tRNA synthetase